MKRSRKWTLLIAAAYALVAPSVGAFIGSVTTVDQVPVELIPTCFGERATIVGVELGTEDQYADWEVAGVDVQANEDEAFLGTTGHDVIVALVSTNSGGIISDPAPASSNPETLPTAGDSICMKNGKADDVVYASKFQADKISTGPGQDDIYTGGGADIVRAGGGEDFIWLQSPGEGNRQKVFGGGGIDHVYAGKNPDGRGIFFNGGPGDDDMIHPCPRPFGPEVRFAGETASLREFDIVKVESIRDEPPDKAVDPCAYQSKSL